MHNCVSSKNLSLSDIISLFTWEMFRIVSLYYSTFYSKFSDDNCGWRKNILEFILVIPLCIVRFSWFENFSVVFQILLNAERDDLPTFLLRNVSLTILFRDSSNSKMSRITGTAWLPQGLTNIIFYEISVNYNKVVL